MKPVMISGTGGPEPDNTDNAAVIRKDDKFYMLYRNPGSHISLAFSDNGTTWTSYSHNPVLSADYDEDLSGRGMENPRLVVDRKSVVKGKSVSVSVDNGGRRIIKKKTMKKDK